MVGGIKPSQIALLLLNPLNTSRLPPAKPHFFEFRNPLSTTTSFPRGICVDWPEKAGANDRRSSPTLPANEQATTARKRACLVPVQPRLQGVDLLKLHQRGEDRRATEASNFRRYAATARDNDCILGDIYTNTTTPWPQYAVGAPFPLGEHDGGNASGFATRC